MTLEGSPAAAPEPASNPFYDFVQQMPLQCFEKERFLQSELLGVQVYPERTLVVMKLKMLSQVPVETYANVSRFLRECLPNVGRIVLDVHYAESVIAPADYLAAHEKDLIFCLSEEADISESWFSYYRVELRDKNLSFQVPNEAARQQLERKECVRVLREILKKRCGVELNVNLQVNPSIIPDKPQPVETHPVISIPKTPVETILYGRKISEAAQSLTVTDEQKGFVGQGEVILFNVFQTKSGRQLAKMTITDYTDSLDAIFLFENDGKFKGGIKEGDWIKVRGDLRFDSRDPNEMVLNARDIMKIVPPRPAWMRLPRSAWNFIATPK